METSDSESNPASAADAATASMRVDGAKLPEFLVDSSELASAGLPLDVARLIRDFCPPVRFWRVFAGSGRKALLVLDSDRNVVPFDDPHAQEEGIHVMRKGGEPLAATLPESTGAGFYTAFPNQEFVEGHSYAITVSFEGYQARNGGILLGMGVLPAHVRSGVVGWQDASWALLSNKLTNYVEFGSANEVPKDRAFEFIKEGSAFGAGDTVTMLVDLSRAAVEKGESTRTSKRGREPGGRLGFVINGKFKGVLFHCLPLDRTLHAAVTLWNLHLQATLQGSVDLGKVSCFDVPKIRQEFEYY